METGRSVRLEEWVGAVHVHSKHSDGRGTVDHIVAAAKRSRLDYCILADHDTLAAQPREGYQDDRLLVLVGCEVTCADNSHCLAIGIRRPLPRGLPPQQVIDGIRSAGGLAIFAHPFDRGSPLFRTHFPWKDWSVTGYEGLEIWNFLVDWAEGMRHPLQAAAGYLLPSLYTTGPNPAGLSKWDALNRKRFRQGQPPVKVIGGVDAHGYFSYRRSLGTVRTHLWAPPKQGVADADRQAILKAMRSGRMFLANDAMHDARGFRFEVVGADGAAYPDGRAEVRGPAELRVVTPIQAEMRIVHDGEVVHTARGMHTDLTATRSGTYRCEVWLTRFGRAKPWIFSNAVNVRAE